MRDHLRYNTGRRQTFHARHVVLAAGSKHEARRLSTVRAIHAVVQCTSGQVSSVQSSHVGLPSAAKRGQVRPATNCH